MKHFLETVKAIGVPLVCGISIPILLYYGFTLMAYILLIAITWDIIHKKNKEK